MRKLPGRGQTPESAIAIARGCYYVLPDFAKFDVKLAVVHGLPVPGSYTIAPAGDRLITANLDLGVALLTNCTILLRDGFEDGVALPGRWSARSGS